MGHETIVVRSTSTIGQVDLYASRCRLASLALCAQSGLPNATSYSLSTEGLDQDILTFNRNDAADSIYIVGVHSISYTAAYHISSSYLHSVLQLQPGVSVMDHVATGDVDYFSFYFNSVGTAISFILTPVS